MNPLRGHGHSEDSLVRMADELERLVHIDIPLRPDGGDAMSAFGGKRHRRWLVLVQRLEHDDSSPGSSTQSYRTQEKHGGAPPWRLHRLCHPKHEHTGVAPVFANVHGQARHSRGDRATA
jgi:hypothetical protein